MGYNHPHRPPGLPPSSCLARVESGRPVLSAMGWSHIRRFALLHDCNKSSRFLVLTCPRCSRRRPSRDRGLGLGSFAAFRPPDTSQHNAQRACLFSSLQKQSCQASRPTQMYAFILRQITVMMSNPPEYRRGFSMSGGGVQFHMET